MTLRPARASSVAAGDPATRAPTITTSACSRTLEAIAHPPGRLPGVPLNLAVPGPPCTHLADRTMGRFLHLPGRTGGVQFVTVGQGDVVRLRGQISNLHSLFVLSMMMTESRDEDEILSLAVTSVGSLGPCTVDGAYRPAADPDGAGGARPERFRHPPGRLRKALAAALLGLGADD